MAHEKDRPSSNPDLREPDETTARERLRHLKGTPTSTITVVTQHQQQPRPPLRRGADGRVEGLTGPISAAAARPGVRARGAAQPCAARSRRSAASRPTAVSCGRPMSSRSPSRGCPGRRRDSRVVADFVTWSRRKALPSGAVQSSRCPPAFDGGRRRYHSPWSRVVPRGASRPFLGRPFSMPVSGQAAQPLQWMRSGYYRRICLEDSSTSVSRPREGTSGPRRQQRGCRRALGRRSSASARRAPPAAADGATGPGQADVRRSGVSRPRNHFTCTTACLRSPTRPCSTTGSTRCASRCRSSC